MEKLGHVERGNQKKKQQPPPGYPTAAVPQHHPCCPYTKKKGQKGFIEGCLAALCCCWLCDVCFD